MNKFMRALRLLAQDGSLDAETAEKLISANAQEKDGGPGSGNFGHKGRPGKLGGSSKEGGSGSSEGSGSESGSNSKISGSGGSASNWEGIASKANAKQKSAAMKDPTIKEPTGVSQAQKGQQPTINYGKEFARQTSSKLQSAGKNLAKAQQKALRDSNMKMADVCFEKAKEWPEGSHEREVYNMYSGILSKPQSGRPTPEQSEKLTQKMFSNISPKLKPAAVERYKKDLANEPQITSDICDIADSIGAEMFGLDYRLKKASDNGEGVCRVDEKIRENIEDANKAGYELSYEDSVGMLGDLVRYTQACTADNLESNANKTLNALKEKGYEVTQVKNTWETFDEKKPYRGVNCTVVSPTGTRFELQFHTAESLVCKEVQHGWYEEARTESTPQERKDELNKRMYENALNMTAPKGIGRLKTIKEKKPWEH